MAAQQETINRVGVDGLLLELSFELLSGRSASLPTRITCVLSGAARSPIWRSYRTVPNQLGDYFSQRQVEVRSVLAALQMLRNRYHAGENYLKLAFKYPVWEGAGRRPSYYTAALEGYVSKTRIKSFVSVSFGFTPKIIVRITVDVSAETILHIEELVQLVQETYSPLNHRRVDSLVESLAEKLESYKRIQDYLILGNQQQRGFSFVAQTWKGEPGGLRPMPGLERSIPDI